MPDPFDANGDLILTRGEIDSINYQLDRVADVVRRQVIAATAVRLRYAMELLREVDSQAGNGAPDHKRHSLTPDTRDRIAQFLK